MVAALQGVEDAARDIYCAEYEPPQDRDTRPARAALREAVRQLLLVFGERL